MSSTPPPPPPDSAMLPRCPFPYANEPACDETIAQTGGGTYTAYMAGWLVAASILFVLHIIQFIRMCRIRGWSRKLFATSYLHQVYTISLYNAFTILLRAVDPTNYAGRYSFAGYRFLTDTSVWAAYALTMMLICSWVKILRQISGRSPRPVVLGERITLGVTLMFFVSASLATSYAEREYLVAAIIEMFCSAYSITLMCFAWGNGLPVYCHLSRFERGQADTAAKLKSTPGSSPVPSSTSSTKLTKSSRSLTKKKLKIIVILKLMVIASICLLIATIMPVYWILQDFQDQYHHSNNPYPYPEWTVGSLLRDSAFMIIESCASIVCIYFFRRFGDSNVDTNHSLDAKSGSSDPTKHTDRFHNRMNSGFLSNNTITGQPQHVRMDSNGLMLTTNGGLLRMNTGLHQKGIPSMEMQERLSGIIVTDTPAPLLNHHIQASDETQQQFAAFQTPPSVVRTHPHPYSRTTSPDQSGATTARDPMDEVGIPPRHPCQPPSPHGSSHLDQIVVVVDTTHTPAESRNSSQDSQSSHSSRKHAAVNHI